MLSPPQKVLLSDAFLIFLAIATQNATAQIAQTAPKLTIDGEVLLEDGNRPAAGVVVTAQALENQSSVRVLTDDHGVFQLRGLPAGKYALFAEEAGYESSRLTVQPDEVVTPLRIYLTRLQPRRSKNVVSARELRIPPKALKAFAQGKVRLDNDDAVGAMDSFQKAISAFSDFPQAHYNLGVAQLRLKQYDGAIESFRKALELRNEPYPLAEFALGVALWENGKPAEAEPLLRRGLEHDGNYAKGYYYLSLALFDLNRIDEAEENASKAQRMQPELPAVYLILANIHANKRMIWEQLRDLETYLKLEPAGPRREATQRKYQALQQKMAAEKQP